jgi:hypothetical protein
MSGQTIYDVVGNYDRDSGALLGVGPPGGPFQTISGGGSSLVISTAAPQPLGTHSPGSTGQVADAGHVHDLPNSLQVGAVPQVAGTWDANANVLKDNNGNTISGSIVSSTAPTGSVGLAYRVSTAGNTVVDGNSIWNVNDIIYWTNTNVWAREAANPITTSLVKGDGSGGLISAVVGVDYHSPVTYTRGIPVGRLDAFSVGANGACILGTPKTSTLTLGATSGSGVSISSSAADFTTGTTDVGKVITLDGVHQIQITSVSSTTAAIGTVLNSATLSGTSFSTWNYGWPVIWSFATHKYAGGLWLSFPANALYSGSPAGIFWAVPTAGQPAATTTAFTVYNNVYTPGTPNSWKKPTSLVPFSGTSGATVFTQPSGSFIIDQFNAIPLGNYGNLHIKYFGHRDASTINTTLNMQYGNASVPVTSLTATGQTVWTGTMDVVCLGPNIQCAFPGDISTTTALTSASTSDSTVSQTVVVSLSTTNLGVGFCIIDYIAADSTISL